jgi:UDP-GlcNAc:undecaprenyl-phosphate GlcNAc-1-phosphate transferase
MVLFKALFILGFALFFYVLAFFAARKWKQIGLNEKAKDAPARWSLQPKPTIGGLLFFAAFVFSFLLRDAPFIAFAQEDIWLLLGAAIAFGTGLWDDLKRISPLHKLIGQALAAYCLITATGAHLHEWQVVSALLVVLIAVGVMNSINMFDNMDGVAGIAALGACSFFLSGANAFMAMALSGALLAFLFFNWRPAKMYMGDSGSLLLGYWLTFFILTEPLPVIHWYGFQMQFLWLLLLVLPANGVDTCVVVLQRLLHKRSPMQGGRDHTTHHLVYFGLPEKWVAPSVVLFIVGSLIFGLDPYRRFYDYFWVSLVYFFALLVFQIAISFRNLSSGKYRYDA